LQFNDINYAIGSSLLFEKLNFTLSMGMIIGLVGMNGSGKSTLLKMMSGLCEPDSGRITFDNHLLYGSRALQSQTNPAQG
jgi:ABC-type bacteriocin/lantibiotic exporter with double-glycine peptidase domain